MEIKKTVEITIKNNDKKHKCCSLQCPFHTLINGDIEFPEDSYCELYKTTLKSYLDYCNSRWYWVERCSQCVKEFENTED